MPYLILDSQGTLDVRAKGREAEGNGRAGHPYGDKVASLRRESLFDHDRIILPAY